MQPKYDDIFDAGEFTFGFIANGKVGFASLTGREIIEARYKEGKPYQQKIAFNMAFHISCIVPGKHVRIIFRWNLSFRLKHIENCHQFFQFIGIVTEPLVILFVLCSGVQLLHNPMERSIASTEDKSRGVELRNAPLWASFIAARVVSLGSLYSQFFLKK